MPRFIFHLLEIVVVMISHVFAGIHSAQIKYGKRTAYLIWGIWAAAQTSLICCSELVIQNALWRFVIDFLLTVVGQYTVFFLTTKGRIGQRVFMLSTYQIIFCIYVPLSSIVKNSFSDMPPLFLPLISGVMLYFVDRYFIRYVCARCNESARKITRGWLHMVLVNAVFTVTIILSSVFPVRLTSFGEVGFFPYLFISISVLAVHPVVFSNINSLSEAIDKREIEQQNKLLLQQIESENLQVERERRARHDRRHHNLVLLELANNNDLEGVRSYLKQLVDGDSAPVGEVRYCGNPTVNTVISVYERRAAEKNIPVRLLLRVGRELPLPPQDLVIVIANLFENAINASARLSSGQRTIEIDVREQESRLLIRVENACRRNLKFDESCHGTGLHSVISTVEKYEGMYDFSAQNGIFSAKVSLNF